MVGLILALQGRSTARNDARCCEVFAGKPACALALAGREDSYVRWSPLNGGLFCLHGTASINR